MTTNAREFGDNSVNRNQESKMATPFGCYWNPQQCKITLQVTQKIQMLGKLSCLNKVLEC